MKNRFIFGALLAGSLLCGQRTAIAEDLDLFVQPAGANGGTPNVLILLDNTANWNTAFTNEIAALVSTVNGLPVNTDGTAKFRVGLMLFTETGNPNSNQDGGYMRSAIRDFTDTGTNSYKTKFQALLNSLSKLGDKSNGGKAGKTFAEAFYYFNGDPPKTGGGLTGYKLKTDYTGNVSGTAASNAIYAINILPNNRNAINSFKGTPYNSPVIAGNCGGNYIIYISNGAAQDNSSDNTTATTWLSTAATAEGISGATTAIPISPSGSQTNVADEWARFMHKSSRGIISYTVDVDKVTTGQGPGWTALLKSVAGVSGGRYFDVSSSTGGGAQISSALNKIFSEIQAVNSVFASVSLPVSVNTQNTYLNQVYVGMFRPDADALPRWAGNLKQYKLGVVSNALRTLDAADQTAINSLTGFISECARSFWTPSVVDSYWAFRPQGGCLAVANSDASNYPDGNIVEKGAQAYRLRSSTTRTVKTCSTTFASCTNTTPTDFNTANAAITQALLVGATSPAERDALIDWEKGLDLDDEDLDAVTSTEMRSSAHGDVVHSRPVAINLGTDASPAVVVFYGGNDGVLRAANGNRAAAIGSVPAGSELWSFVAPEFYGSIKRLRDNTTPLSYKGSTEPPTRAAKPYGFDGPIESYRDASNTWIFATMRRGGRFLYTFDVTNITTAPGSVPLKWKLGCPNQADDSGCSSGLTGIGQTWSSPKNIKTDGYLSGGSPAPMLIMGGGSDTCEDADPHTCTTSAKGRYVYLMDASSGGLLQTFTTDRPVTADIFVVNDSSTGLAQHAYVVDMGGNVYRITGSTANAAFAATAPGSWTMTKIASLGCDTTASCAANRKFLFAPDVVLKDGIYYLMIGSGDREKPLLSFTTAYGVDNKFFMIKDVPSDATWLDSEVSNCGSAIICLGSLVAIANDGADPDPADLAAKKGWALDLRDHEQGVTSAITVFGTVTFSTHTPALPVVGACSSNLGTARVYNIRYANAAIANGANNRDAEISGGGLPPSPVAGMVQLDDGSVVPFLIGGSPDSPLEGGLPSPAATGTQPKSLTYWYIEK